MKTYSYLARLLLALCAFVCFHSPPARAADAVPTVTTDREDYPPYSVVWITGAGFQSDETVSNQVVQVAGPAAGTAYEPWEVVADTNGGFETSWFVFTDDLANTTLQLTSTGESSGLSAQATFTDGTTPLPLRSDSTTCIFGGSSSQTIDATFGSSISTLAFTATTTYDFFSPPLGSSQALTGGNRLEQHSG